jgi:ornithine cyclodeaminase/alanine dehydrogenase-like protein (mu-crystallin family)
MSMLYLTEKDVRDLLPMADCIELMQTAFERLASGEALNQPRRRLILPTGSVLHYMAASDGQYYGAKIYATNPRHGAHFLFLLYRAADAQPLAIIEANHLGQIRTGAASGLATRFMAREDASTLAIIGSGFQARTQLEAMLAVRKISEVRVWSRDPAKRAAFAAETTGSIGARAVETAEQAVRGAQIVVTATYAKEPVLSAEWVEPGAHINAMGSNQANRREIPAELVRRADLIAVDSIDQARMESGDLLMAWDDAEQDWSSPRLVELKDVVTGRVQARTGPRQKEAITLFKSIGLAVEDVIAAAFVYERACAAGVGTPVATGHS